MIDNEKTAGAADSGWIVGLNHGSHDAAAVLLHHGVPKVWIEQERLSRRKHAVGESPAHALAACLQSEGLRLSDLDAVALGSDHDSLAKWLGLSKEERHKILPYDNPEWLFPDDFFPGETRPQTYSVPHHLAHAASTFLVSGFDEAAILIADAMGENTSITLAHGKGRNIEILEDFGVEDSLGFFYEAACRFVGFSRHQAGKLMGLAAYGVPRNRMPLSTEKISSGQLWTIRKGARTPGRKGIEERERDLLEHFATNCYPFSVGKGSEIMAYQDFAASAQSALQTSLLALAETVCERTSCQKLAMAGGVALNCTANGAIAKSDFVKELFVQPASTDSGVALGAALHIANERSNSIPAPYVMSHAYLSGETTKKEIEKTLLANGLSFLELSESELCSATAELIASDGVVAWHQGRAEIGPRALGARSLLGNPARRSTLIRMNHIKSREVWRPLAPSILAEEFGNYFEGTPNPFMIVAASVKPEIQSRIAAVTHVDGSARPQAVYEETSPRYARLIREVRSRTGIPIVVNTSLNGPKEPICYSAEDSIRFFLSTSVDALAIGDFLVIRGAE